MLVAALLVLGAAGAAVAVYGVYRYGYERGQRHAIEQLRQALREAREDRLEEWHRVLGSDGP